MKKLSVSGLMVLVVTLLLSSPVFANTYTVTTTADTGIGSLAKAVADANSHGGADAIVFNIPTSEATHEADYYWWSIKPSSGYWLSDPITIDGTTQPTNETYKNPYGPVIEIDGTNVPSAGAVGVFIAADDSLVKGLVINNFGYGIGTHGSRDRIIGNYVGVNVTGEISQTFGAIGINIDQPSFVPCINNTIGDGTAQGRNIISTASECISLTLSNSNEIIGNYVGLNKSGTKKLSSGTGIYITGSYQKIGGTTAGERNVISSSLPIFINGESGTGEGNLIYGNYIGTNATATSAIPIEVGVSIYRTKNNKVGCSAPNGGNTIAGAVNGSAAGIQISGGASSNEVIGNYIGTNSIGATGMGNGKGVVMLGFSNHNTIGDGTASGSNIISRNSSNGIEIDNGSSNRITDNSIFLNGGQGILLYPGANMDIAYPIIETAEYRFLNGTFVSGEAPPNSIVELFISDNDPSGYGGEIFVGSTESNVSGKWSVTVEGVSVGDKLSATATDQNNNTSMFSLNLAVVLVPIYDNPSLGVTVYVPEGATTEAVTIEASIVASPGVPPEGLRVGGQIIQINSNVTSFLTPITITITKSGATVNNEIYYWTGSIWSNAGIVIISETATTITFTTTHLSIFGIFGLQSGTEPRFGPNPYNPDGNTGARFWYVLTKDEATKIYVFDLGGSVVWKKSFTKGANGGRAGENSVAWDGADSFGRTLATGTYLYKIIQGTKVIEGGKIAIIRK